MGKLNEEPQVRCSECGSIHWRTCPWCETALICVNCLLTSKHSQFCTDLPNWLYFYRWIYRQVPIPASPVKGAV